MSAGDWAHSGGPSRPDATAPSFVPDSANTASAPRQANSIDETRPELQQTWASTGSGNSNAPLSRSRSLYRNRSDSTGSERPRAVLQRKHASVLPPPTVMEQSRPAATSISSGSTTSSRDWKDDQSGLGPFTLRHGRRYLRDQSYPLPVDLLEVQRQNLQTLLATQVFGKPLCSQHASETPPQRVLEVACGSGFWSAQCHDYLAESGCLNVSFTGMDIVQIAPDYNQQGINWRFCQHDIRKVPFPFEDETFDLIVLKDLSLVLQQNQPSQRVLDEAIRMLRPHGVLEIWEVDHTIRSLLPHPPPPPNKRPEDLHQAYATATFLISAATPFGPAENRFIQDYNTWIGQALDKRKLSPVPCARMQPMLLQEDELWDVGFRRVAVPLGEMSWERQDPRLIAGRQKHDSGLSGMAVAGDAPLLTPEQESLRDTALLVIVQLIESLEPLLKEVSGKNQEEWQRWWAGMMQDLFQNDGANSGECLEIGAYWARKKG